MKAVPFVVASFVVAATAGPALAADVEKGRGIWSTSCEICHGADGIAAIDGAPSFKKGERLEKSDAELKETIKKGLKEMPGWGQVLSDADIDSVLAYLRTLKK